MPNQKQISDIASKMRGIDIAILTTKAEDGEFAGRPMSNNGDVDYNGNSYYFTFEESHTVGEIERDPQVGLGFTGRDLFYVSVAGKAELIRDKKEFKEHWTPELDRWFKDGAETPGVVMIKVRAHRMKYWDGMESGEVTLQKR